MFPINKHPLLKESNSDLLTSRAYEPPVGSYAPAYVQADPFD